MIAVVLISGKNRQPRHSEIKTTANICPFTVHGDSLVTICKPVEGIHSLIDMETLIFGFANELVFFLIVHKVFSGIPN